MPTYVYGCRKCKHRFEVFHSITDESPRRCPNCGGKAARVPAGGAGILFKGSGFYITDYRSKSYKEKARQEKPGGAKGGGSTGGSEGSSSGTSEGTSSGGSGGSSSGGSGESSSSSPGGD